MPTSLADQYASQPDWYSGATIGAGPGFAITDTGSKDAVITRNAAGVYDLQLGNGGIDTGHREFTLDCDVNAIWSVADTDNTHKRFTLVDNAGVAIDPTRLMITCRRLLV